MKKSHLIFYSMSSIALYACNGGSNNNTFTPVALQWESCDPKEYIGITQEMVDTLGDRLSCTKMVAPMDYSNPSRGNIEVAFSKVSAEIPSERSGSIFFNPGGPGASGLREAPDAGIAWANANPNDPLGAKLKQLSNQYDLIGFAPRGVANSTELICHESGNISFPLNFNESLTSTSNQYKFYMNDELMAQACNINELTPFINTDATVRDMDLMRSLLGDSKISYIGYSYGTWLGSWYAGVFPAHVDKMVLDSSANITQSLTQEFLSQPQALQNITDNIIAPYAALNESIFDLGNTQDIQNIYPQLNNGMKLTLRYFLYRPLFAQRLANTAVETLSAAKVVNQLIVNNPYANKNQILVMVRDYSFSSDTKVDSDTHSIAYQMVQTYFQLMLQEPSLTVSDTNRAVTCNDTPHVATSFTEWLAMINQIVVTGPIFGVTAMNFNCTDQWNRPSITQPSIDSIRSSSPIMMVQTQYDGATPLQGALTTYNAIGTASMVYVTNSYNHGVFNIIGNGCVDNAVADYLLTGKTPETQLLVCQGQSILPNMNSIAKASMTQTSFLPASLANKATYGNDISITNSFKDKEKAQKYREQIQSNIINAELINK